MKTAIILAALALLAGCDTMPQQQVQQAPRPTAADDPSVTCARRAAVMPQFAPLSEKIAINMRADQVSLEMLADRARPTDQEKALLSAWQQQRVACFDVGVSFRAAYAPPRYVAWLSSSHNGTSGLVARLYGGDMTYGEFNRARASLAADTEATRLEMQQRERETQAAAAAQDDANRRAAAGMMLQNMQNQQLLQQQLQQQQMQQMQQNRPSTTNCQRFGNQVNCTTY